MSVATRRSWLEPEGAISMRAQCERLSLSRAALFYTPVSTSALNLELLRKIDEHFTEAPFYGSRRLTACLQRDGYEVNRKRVQRLMQVLGIEAIYQKPRTSTPATGAPKYPYLLKGLAIVAPNQVWATDITYIRMRQGFLYLVAILDWFSRYVVAWELSNSLEGAFCVSALESALTSKTPSIFNSDQGNQFTAHDFLAPLLARGVRISMDGRGRCFDNIFTERLWRSVKYEEVYLKAYDDGREAHEGLRAYFNFYNNKRPHQALGYRTPREVHFAATPGREHHHAAASVGAA